MAYDNYFREVISGSSVVATSQTLTFAAAQTCNFDSGRVATVTMTDNFTSLTLSGGAEGGIYALKIVQDGTGSRTLSGASADIVWGGTTLYGTTHTAPTLTTTASRYDIFFFMKVGSKYIEIHRSMGNT
jgi:uncharacterized protein (DUF2141 family)